MSKKRETIYNYFSCNICVEPNSGHLSLFGHPHRWVYHFLLIHSKKYKQYPECHGAKCFFKYKTYKNAVIHYRQQHIALHSRCIKCNRTFNSIKCGREHKLEGCGSYMRCRSCFTTVFGSSRIRFHKTGGCMVASDGCGLPDSDSDNEQHSAVED